MGTREDAEKRDARGDGEGRREQPGRAAGAAGRPDRQGLGRGAGHHRRRLDRARGPVQDLRRGQAEQGRHPGRLERQRGRQLRPSGAARRPRSPSWKAGAAQRWKDLADLGLKAYPARDRRSRRKAFSTRARSPTASPGSCTSTPTSRPRPARPAYLYQFVHNPPAAEGKPSGGATHASELAYVFNNLDKPREVPDPSSPEVASKSAPDIKLADQMSSYWTNFAKTGNPNGPGLPNWPQVTQAEGKPGVPARRQLASRRYDDAGAGRALRSALQSRRGPAARNQTGQVIASIRGEET